MVHTIHASDNAPMLWDRNAAGNDMDDIRLEQIDQLDRAMASWKKSKE